MANFTAVTEYERLEKACNKGHNFLLVKEVEIDDHGTSFIVQTFECWNCSEQTTKKRKGKLKPSFWKKLRGLFKS